MVTRWRGCVEVRGGGAFFDMLFRSRQRPNKAQINFSHRHSVESVICPVRSRDGLLSLKNIKMNLR
jgi:hypothetical protein